MAAKNKEVTMKRVFGVKKKGAQKKKFGPKDEKPSKYRGQGK